MTPGYKDRKFERYSVSLKAVVKLKTRAKLEAEVKSLDDIATGYSEKVVLKDISGGGTRFVTKRPEHYSVGDNIDIVIQLPGGGSLKAEIKGAGKVAWMGEVEEGKVSIGLSMSDLLTFDSLGGESD